MTHMRTCISIALVAIACPAVAQSTGSFSSPSTGSGAAGASPVGIVLPYTVQSGSTAPTQPGHTITGDRATHNATRTSSRGDAGERDKDGRAPQQALEKSAQRSP